MEFRAFDFEVRELEQDGTFEGYASVFGNIDAHGTVVDKGAFKQTIRHNKGEFPLLWFHDPMTPVGMTFAEEDDNGLKVRGVLDLDVEPGKRVYSGLKRGYIDRMSIGFNRVTERLKDGVTHFTELALWENSLVTRNFASNDLALVGQVRAAISGTKHVDGFAEVLRRLRAAMTLPTEEVTPVTGDDGMAITTVTDVTSDVVDGDTREDTEPHGEVLTALEALTRTLAGESTRMKREADYHSALAELRRFKLALTR